MEWDRFIKIHKTEDLLVLVSSQNTFIALPKKFLKSDKDWVMARNIIESKVKEAK